MILQPTWEINKWQSAGKWIRENKRRQVADAFEGQGAAPRAVCWTRGVLLCTPQWKELPTQSAPSPWHFVIKRVEEFVHNNRLQTSFSSPLPSVRLVHRSRGGWVGCLWWWGGGIWLSFVLSSSLEVVLHLNNKHIQSCRSRFCLRLPHSERCRVWTDLKQSIKTWSIDIWSIDIII